MTHSALNTHSAQYEELRLAALADYDILDTPPDVAFDDIAKIAAFICDVPSVVINFIDRDRQWFKSVLGLNVRETPLDISICKHVILQQGLFVVPDTKLDPRFVNNPLVTGEPNVRFYAGAVLKNDDGYPLGTLCVLDDHPRDISEKQRFALSTLANQVMTQLELLRHHKKQVVLIQDLQTAHAELKTAHAELLQLASTDPLSGLLNRRAFEPYLDRELALIKRSEAQATLVMIDFDHFKRINDDFGHDIGDEVIQRFAQLFRRIFRQSDVISRWGGEEFMVLMPMTSKADALQTVERLHQSLKNAPIVYVDQQPVFITISVGICSLTPDRESHESLRIVDKLLYMAKENGRNCTVCESSLTDTL
ncbi:sensor domain-containing diguanylate cyclase [Oceanisphaera sp. W20_SRM_FM3]|uniref:sensor domain-containing diguanylate cyclase n=1 Tax=Oceanisphaera sp. W20_SRM_FM3 TaxID=3240267 RepID=UPI003F9CF073